MDGVCTGGGRRNWGSEWFLHTWECRSHHFRPRSRYVAMIAAPFAMPVRSELGAEVALSAQGTERNSHLPLNLTKAKFLCDAPPWPNGWWGALASLVCELPSSVHRFAFRPAAEAETKRNPTQEHRLSFTTVVYCSS